MPIIVTITMNSGVLVPEGWRLVRSLRGRSVYTYYSEEDTEMRAVAGYSQLRVKTRAAAEAIERELTDSSDEELVGLLTKLNIG